MGYELPFGLDIVDQVWPENFGGLYKAQLKQLTRAPQGERLLSSKAVVSESGGTSLVNS
jgi:hypothetical protein